MSMTVSESEAPERDLGGTVVTVHLRTSPSSAAARRQRTVLSKLEHLESEGAVSDLQVERWSKRVNVPTPESAGSDAAAVELFSELEDAAEEAGARLEPFFEKRRAASGLLSAGPPSERVLVFPVVCLTVREGDSLVGLYPCWKDGVHHSVEDALDRLADDGDLDNL